MAVGGPCLSTVDPVADAGVIVHARQEAWAHLGVRDEILVRVREKSPRMVHPAQQGPPPVDHVGTAEGPDAAGPPAAHILPHDERCPLAVQSGFAGHDDLLSIDVRVLRVVVQGVAIAAEEHHVRRLVEDPLGVLEGEPERLGVLSLPREQRVPCGPSLTICASSSGRSNATTYARCAE